MAERENSHFFDSKWLRFIINLNVCVSVCEWKSYCVKKVNYTVLLFVSLVLVLVLLLPLTPTLAVLFVVDVELSATVASIFLSLPGLYDSKNASIAVSVGLYI